ncbi:MAG: hypothetical protein K6U80_19980 [Firmicutes bacterium]|nr:hypothetical protein [Bacillota bacterium]
MTDYVAKYQGAEIYRVHQEMDGLGRITRKVEIVLGETHTYEYVYDQAGRLVDVYKDGVLVSHYDYDPNGNRLAHVTPSGTSHGTYDDQDRMLSYGEATYEYTANGELLRKTDAEGVTHYTYDVLGNLKSVVLPDGTRIEYIVDGQNRRIGKKVNGVLVQGFLYQDWLEPVAELDGAGNVVARFVYASRSHVPDYMVKNGVVYRIISDHLGSVRLVVDVATGQIVQRMDYDEFGNVILDTNPGFQPFGFAGGIYDLQSQLIKFGVRDYDTRTGRWISKDPFKFHDHGTNLYNYALSNPINFNDNSGLSPFILYEGIVISIFVKNYMKMREANTIGADKYFHCMANCEASRLGLIGELTAMLISEAREIFDYITGDPRSACNEDRIANMKGRKGDKNKSCREVCSEFRPKALDPQY